MVRSGCELGPTHVRASRPSDERPRQRCRRPSFAPSTRHKSRHKSISYEEVSNLGRHPVQPSTVVPCRTSRCESRPGHGMRMLHAHASCACRAHRPHPHPPPRRRTVAHLRRGRRLRRSGTSAKATDRSVFRSVQSGFSQGTTDDARRRNDATGLTARAGCLGGFHHILLLEPALYSGRSRLSALGFWTAAKSTTSRCLPPSEPQPTMLTTLSRSR